MIYPEVDCGTVFNILPLLSITADIPVFAEVSIYLLNSIARNTECLRCCSSCFDSLNHESLVATHNI